MSIDAGRVEGSLGINLVDWSKGINSAIKDISKLDTISKRLSQTITKENDKAAAAYRKLAASLDPVVAKEQKYTQSVETLNRALKAGVISQEQYNRTLSQAQAKLKETVFWTDRLGNSIGSSLSGEFGKFFALSAAIGAVVGTIKSVFSQFIQANIEAEESQRKVAAAVAQSGNASGITAAQISKLADSYSLLTGIDDEEIANAEAVAVKYNRLGAEVFPRVIQAALDMSAATGGDLSASMEKAAKLVNQPLRALTLLGKEGYAVSASQADLVKSMLRSNDIAGAQGVILGILESQYSGTAAAMRDTMGGALRALSTAWENLLEKLGEDNTGPLRDGLEQLISLIESLTAKVDSLNQGWLSFSIVLAKAAPFMNIGLGLNYDPKALDAAKKDLQELETKLYDIQSKKAFEGLVKSGVIPKQVADIVGLLGDETKKTTGHTLELTDAETKLSDALDGVKDSIKDLEQQYQSARKIREASLKGPAAVNAEKDQQAAIATVLKLQNQLKSQGLSLSAEQIKHVTALVIGTKEEERLASVLAKAHEKIGNLAYRTATAIEEANEKLKKANPVAYILFENALKETLKDFNLLLPRVDLLGKGLKNVFDLTIPIELLQRFADIIESTATNEERRAKALLETINLMRLAQSLGAVTPGQANETIQRAGIANANPLFTKAEQELYDFRQNVIDSFKTISQSAAQETADIERAFAGFEDDLDLMAVKEAALSRIRLESIERQFGAVTDLAGFIGNIFGGAAKQIAAAFSNIQGAYQVGKKIDASGFGSSAGISGSWGGILAVVQIFYEIYSAVDAAIKKAKARKFGESTRFEVLDGEWSSPSHFGPQGQKISLALRNMVREITDSLDAVLDDLPQIVIKARKDSKQFSAYVAGIFVGVFGDAQEALEAAVSTAIQQANFSAISHELAVALQASIGATLDELQANIETARSARRARIGDTGEQYLNVADTWRQIIDAEQRLGLAIDDSVAARNRELAAIKNNVLGIDSSVSDQLRSLGSLSKGITEAADGMRAQLEQQIQATLDAIARAENAASHPNIGSGSGGSGNVPTGSGAGGNDGGDPSFPGSADHVFTKAIKDMTNGALDTLRQQLDRYRSELDKIPQALSDLELNMGIFDALYKYLQGNSKYAAEANKFARIKVEIEFAQIKAQLILLNKWEEFSGMFTDAYNAALAAAGKTGKGGGKGAGSDNKSSVKSFIDDKKYQLNTAGLSEYFKQIADISREYDKQIEQAGKDKGLRQQLIALKDKELAQLAKERAGSVVKDFQKFTGVTNQFDDIRNTAKDLIKEIEDSPFGNARKAAMIGRVMAEVDKQVAALSAQMTVSIFGEMISDLEAFGADESVLSEARKQMALIEHTIKMEHYKTEIAILKAQGKLAPEVVAALDAAFAALDKVDPLADITNTVRNAQEKASSLFGELIGDLEKYGASESQLTEIRKAQAIIEHTLKMQHYAAEIALLKAQGKIDPASLKAIEDAFKFLQGVDPTAFIANTSAIRDALAAKAEARAQRLEQEISSVRDLLKRYKDEGIDPYHRALRDLNEDFQRIRATLGNTSEVTQEYAAALARLNNEYLQGLRDVYDELRSGPQSGANVEQQYQAQFALWNQLANSIRTTGDLSLADEAAAAAQRSIELLGQLYGTSTGGFAEIRAQILAQLEQLLGIGGGGSTGGTGTGTGLPSGPFIPSPSTPGTIPTLPGTVGPSLGGSSSSGANSGQFGAPGQPSAAQNLAAIVSLQSTLVSTSGDDVAATDRTTGAVNLHGIRIETLLSQVSTKLGTMIDIMDTPNNGYGNGGVGGSIVYGDTPGLPRLGDRSGGR